MALVMTAVRRVSMTSAALVQTARTAGIGASHRHQPLRYHPCPRIPLLRLRFCRPHHRLLRHRSGHRAAKT
eukprot:2306122-Prymnesium_polylepis.1